MHVSQQMSDTGVPSNKVPFIVKVSIASSHVTTIGGTEVVTFTSGASCSILRVVPCPLQS